VAKDIFSRLSAGRPLEPEEPTPQQVPLAAGRLLNWIQQKWKQPVIRARDICQYGPHPTRDRESTLKLTEILEGRGWLVPMPARRYDTKMWRIAIEPWPNRSQS